MWTFIIHNMKKQKTTAYLIQKDKIEIINYNKITSRGSTIMLDIEKRIMNLK